jgi:hypothetical protein
MHAQARPLTAQSRIRGADKARHAELTPLLHSTQKVPIYRHFSCTRTDSTSDTRIMIPLLCGSKKSQELG